MSHRRVLVLVLCTGLAAGPALADVARVTAANANLRSAPGTSSRVVATLSRGASLDVLEAPGEWLKVRVTDTNAEGWVHRSLVEVTRSAPAPAAPVTPVAPTAPVPPAAPAATTPVTIEHQDVGCIVAGQYPKLEACFRPDGSVGRGRVLFRGAGTEPWYYVDMTRDGPCYAALLPKPKPELKGMEYFVDVMDKAFVETIKPDKAPGQAFMPRVVKKQEDCDRDRKFALFLTKAARPIVVGIARDPTGGILTQAAAKALESQAALAGFSSDGVVISSTGAAPGASAGSSTASNSAGGAGGGGGIPTIAIVGGVLAAGALVAVVAGGGGGSSGSGGSGGSSGSSPSNPGQGGTGGSGLSVTGVWSGTSANGGGMTYAFSVEGASCTFHYDMGLNLTQNGSSVGGSMTYTGRTAMCSLPEAEAQQIINSALAGFQDSGGFPVTGNASDAGSVTLSMGGLTFSGTYNRTNMDISSAGPSVPGATVQPMTIRVVRAQ